MKVPLVRVGESIFKLEMKTEIVKNKLHGPQNAFLQRECTSSTVSRRQLKTHLFSAEY